MLKKFIVLAAVLIPLSSFAQKNSTRNQFYDSEGVCEMPPRSERLKDKDRAIRFTLPPQEFMKENEEDKALTYIGPEKIERLLKGIDYRLESRSIESGDILVSIRPANPNDTLKIKTILSTSDLGVDFRRNSDELGDGNPLYDACREKALMQAKENAESAAKITGMKLGRVDRVKHYYDPPSNTVKAEIRFELD